MLVRASEYNRSCYMGVIALGSGGVDTKSNPPPTVLTYTEWPYTFIILIGGKYLVDGVTIGVRVMGGY